MLPIVDTNAQNFALENELRDAFERVLRSGHFILGPEVAALEQEIASLGGVGHAIAVSSGTDAILLALMVLGIGPGDEVLCPAFTFFATAGCVARVGAKPVFVDVSPVTFNIDPVDAARKVSKQTKAVIPVHLFGQCAEMASISKLAQANGLAVIEDAAQSMGAGYDGQRAGSIGGFGTFSFYPTKNLGGLGDGGMLVCRDAAHAEKARVLRNHGAEQTYYHTFVGGNFRLDALQAAFLRVKLARYSDYTRQRKANAAYYTEKLSKLPGAELANDLSQSVAGGLILPVATEKSDHIWNQYTVRVAAEKRDAFRAFLKDRGIQTGVYYPLPLNQQECFASLGQEKDCPVAIQLSKEVVSLPVYPELKQENLDQVVGAVSEFITTI